MLRKKTVFIVGAGASFEFGLPTGATLQRTIAESLDIRFASDGRLISGNIAIWEASNRLGRMSRDLQHAAWRIRDGIPLANSIDNFMHVHQEDRDVQVVGKLAIANAITMAERNSRLFLNARSGNDALNFVALSDTWLVKLFRILQEDVPKSSLERLFDRSVFLTFNYDRCLEHFLAHAVATYYQVDFSQAAKVMSRAKIGHVYGSLGPLAWQPHDGTSWMEFGVPRRGLENVAELISTYGEQLRDQTARTEWLTWIEGAEQLCFLGFSFQAQNVRLISPDNGFRGRLFGTAHGVSDFDRRAIVRDLKTRLAASGGPASLEKVTCSELFDSFSRFFK